MERELFAIFWNFNDSFDYMVVDTDSCRVFELLVGLEMILVFLQI